MNAPTVPSDGRMRRPHRNYDLTVDRISVSGMVPLALIRASAQGTDAAADASNVMRPYAVLGTGASAAMVPMWALRDLGVVFGRESMTRVAAATGWAVAYRASVGPELPHGDEWPDLGSINVQSPDTEMPRHRKYNLPFLPGRDGFFGRFHMLFDQAGGEARLRRIDDCGRPATAEHVGFGSSPRQARRICPKTDSRTCPIGSHGGRGLDGPAGSIGAH